MLSDLRGIADSVDLGKLSEQLWREELGERREQRERSGARVEGEERTRRAKHGRMHREERSKESGSGAESRAERGSN